MRAEVEDFRARAVDWLAGEKATAPPDWGPIMPAECREQGMEWQQRLHAAGFAAIDWPVEHGGQGLSSDHHRVWLESCAEAEVPAFLNMAGLVLAAGALRRFGTEEQRLAHLPATARGERVWCQLFSEPSAGSDLASLQTRASLVDGCWVLNGHKVWSSGARASDWGLLLARTEEGVGSHRGISFFLIDMHSAGVETRPLRQITGEAQFDEVIFTDVRLPVDALVGSRGQGWEIATGTLANERVHIGSMSRSLTRRLDSLQAQAVAYDVAGPARDRLMQLYVRARAYAFMSDQGGADEGGTGLAGASARASLGKLAMMGLLFDLAEWQADVAGAAAMLTGPESRGLVGVTGGWFGGGTSQVQRNVIGERVLGLPREPRPI